MRDAEFSAKLHDRSASDAFESASWRTEYFSVHDCKHVETWPLSQKSIAVEQHGSFKAGIESLKIRLGKVAPMKILYGRVNGLRRNTRG